MENLLEILSELRDAFNEGSIKLIKFENADCVFAINSAIADMQRMEFVENHGVEYNGLNAYFFHAGTHRGKTLRECIDSAIKSPNKLGSAIKKDL